MWSCPRCHESIEDSFDVCWKCGTSREGRVDPTFLNREIEPAPENLPLEEELPAAQEGEPEPLVTVAQCNLPAEAHAMRLHLQEAGIAVFLADEFTVTMDWLLSNAVGGVKVQVPASRADEAAELLAAFSPRRPEAAEDDESDDN
jgi:hypothetical protein